MTTLVEVLSAARRAEVHERALRVLARTGLRVESTRARTLLGAAGAQVDEGDLRVRLPRTLVEAALASAPRTFALGGRRPGWELRLDGTGCSLLADGEALQVLDAETGTRRPATQTDWERSTDLLDAIEEVGVYWRMVDPDGGDPPPGANVRSWVGAFTRFSRHIQDSAADPDQAAWLLEILGIVFGGRDEVRRTRRGSPRTTASVAYMHTEGISQWHCNSRRHSLPRALARYETTSAPQHLPSA